MSREDIFAKNKSQLTAASSTPMQDLQENKNSNESYLRPFASFPTLKRNGSVLTTAAVARGVVGPLLLVGPVG